MIPLFDPNTGYLPAGMHKALWAEVVSRFSTNSHRAQLVMGLYSALTNLAFAGCQLMILDGSFVTNKPLPNDYDGAWEPCNVDPSLLDPVLLDFSNKRAAMKAKYKGELFPAHFDSGTGILYRDFFLKDRSGIEKGVIEIDLGSLS